MDWFNDSLDATVGTLSGILFGKHGCHGCWIFGNSWIRFLVRSEGTGRTSLTCRHTVEDTHKLILLYIYIYIVLYSICVCKAHAVMHKFSFHLQPRIHCFTLLLKHGPLRRGFGYPPPSEFSVPSQKPSTARSTRNGAHPTQSWTNCFPAAWIAKPPVSELSWLRGSTSFFDSKNAGTCQIQDPEMNALKGGLVSMQLQHLHAPNMPHLSNFTRSILQPFGPSKLHGIRLNELSG